MFLCFGGCSVNHGGCASFSSVVCRIHELLSSGSIRIRTTCWEGCQVLDFLRTHGSVLLILWWVARCAHQKHVCITDHKLRYYPGAVWHACVRHRTNSPLQVVPHAVRSALVHSLRAKSRECTPFYYFLNTYR